MKANRSKVDATVSLVGLTPIAGHLPAHIAADAQKGTPDATLDYTASPFAHAAGLEPRAANDVLAKPATSVRAARKPALGLPAPKLLKDKLTKGRESEPADALPWTPSAPTPAAIKSVRPPRPSNPPSSPSRPPQPVRETDRTVDLSMADLSFAGTQAANEADKTEVDSIDELSLTELDAAANTSIWKPQVSAPADDGASELGNGQELTTLVPRKPRSSAAWLFLATFCLAGVGWFVFGRTIARDEVTNPSTLAVVERQPNMPQQEHPRVAASAPALRDEPSAALADSRASDATPPAEVAPATPPTEVAPVPEANPAPAEGESVRPTPEGDAVAESDEASGEEADEDEPESDATQRGAATRARELVEQGRALQKRKKYKPADQRFREALTVYPGYPRALKGLARLAIAQHKGKLAVTFATQLQRARPGQAANWVLLGDAYKSAGKRKEAREAWETAARKGSATARARLKR